MKIVKTILQVLLIAQFSFFGISKVIATPDMVEGFAAFGTPTWFMVFTGLVELSAVACLIYGFFNRNSVYAGAFLLAGLTVGATLLHLFVEGSTANAIPPVVVFVQNALMITLHHRVVAKTPQVAIA